MALKPFEWHFEMEKHLPVVNHGSQWESPASLPASSCPPEEVVCVFTLSVNGDNVKDQQFSCVFKMSGSAGGLPIPYRAGLEGQQVSSFDWHFKKSQCTLMFCWSPAALSVFSTEQVREGAMGGQATCTYDHTSVCDQAWVTVRLICDVSPCGKQQHDLVQKPPSPLLFFYPLGKLIWRCFSPYWLVFRAPSPIPLPIPQAFLCLSCHVLFFFLQFLSVLPIWRKLLFL